MRPRSLLLAALAAAAAHAPATAAERDATRKQVLVYVDRLRAVPAGAGQDATERYDRELDEAWRFFETHAPVALPVLREQLALELRKERRNPLVLLDVGAFLHAKGAAPDRELARDALFALDPAAEAVRANDRELFVFAHQVASARDPRTLPFVDRAFLRGDVTVIVPEHALRLGPSLVCAFLYGAYGDGAEEHLLPLLRDPAVARRVLEILVWIGSPAAIPEVRAAYGRSREGETFARLAAFMMKAGGPEGRDALLSIRPDALDVASREHLEKILPSVRDTGYESLRREFGAPGAAPQLTEAEARARLAAMIAHDGMDDATEPGSLLDSPVPSGELIAALAKVRATSFRRVSDEALTDVEVANAIMNALRYRGR